MSGRIWLNPERLFDVFVSIDLPSNAADVKPNYTFPSNYDSADILANVAKFAYPCKYEPHTVEQYVFVLTDIEAKFHYGFCRISMDHGIICMISRLPWFDVFNKILNKIAEVMNSETPVERFLQALLEKRVPGPREACIVVSTDLKQELTFEGPDLSRLPTIPNDRNLSEYYSAVDYDIMIKIFANMLNERRVIITSKRLSRMTACCHASAALLYPMNWQHLFIPVLPETVIDYVIAPMPYIVGVHSSMMSKVRRMEIGDAVIVNADTGELEDPHNDGKNLLPSEALSSLKKDLKGSVDVNHGDSISRAFLRAVVRIIGCYRDGLKYNDDMIEFDSDVLLANKSGSMRVCLEAMLQLQTYQQFIEERLVLLNSGKGFSDEFELEISRLHNRGDSSKYKEWLGNMKKQGKKLKKQGQSTFSGITKKVKEVSKKAYKDARHKLDEGVLKRDYSIIDRGGSRYGNKIAAARPTAIAIPAVKPQRASIISALTSHAALLSSGNGILALRPNLQERIKKKNSIVSPIGRRDSYDRALKKYNTLSFDDDDLFSPNMSDLLNDPDLQNYMQRSHSFEKFQMSSEDDGMSLNSVGSVNIVQSHVAGGDAPPRPTAPPRPIAPPRKKKVVVSSESNSGDNISGFEDSFVTPSVVTATAPVTTSVADSLHTDLVGLDLSPSSTLQLQTNTWSVSQPNYYVTSSAANGLQPMNNPFLSPGDPIQRAQMGRDLSSYGFSTPLKPSTQTASNSVFLQPQTIKPDKPKDPLSDLRWDP